ncbi:uncharacterized protein LOC118437618 [Folsomia candida]|uniref:uncharacterized protein LOC118437618 n=1 Tax=Folsomia candida TaxID=158441 RepID=UPI0016050C91|nr:uncharacterized protein LOC118437618 [Folsomia candida]
MADKDKPKQATAVKSTSEQDAAAAVETAQSSQGAASVGVMAAARSSMASSSTSVTTTARTDQSKAYSTFMAGLEQCMAQYSTLGSWLSDQICGYMGAVDIPAMYKKFMELSPLERALIIIALLGLVGLLGWMAWEGVTLAWPHLIKFLESSPGQNFLETAGTYLKGLAESDVMKKFVGIFASASEPGEDKEDTPCFDKENWTMLTSVAAVSITEIVRVFFAYMSTNAMKK